MKQKVSERIAQLTGATVGVIGKQVYTISEARCFDGMRVYEQATAYRALAAAESSNPSNPDEALFWALLEGQEKIGFDIAAALFGQPQPAGV